MDKKFLLFHTGTLERQAKSDFSQAPESHWDLWHLLVFRLHFSWTFLSFLSLVYTSIAVTGRAIKSYIVRLYWEAETCLCVSWPNYYSWVQMKYMYINKIESCLNFFDVLNCFKIISFFFFFRAFYLFSLFHDMIMTSSVWVFIRPRMTRRCD